MAYAGTVPQVEMLPAGTVLQVVNTMSSTLATGSTILPLDNTIPQSTEGDQYMSLAITPKSASNTLVIEVVANAANSAGNTTSVALFQDATANALAAVALTHFGVANSVLTQKLTHKMTAGTTSATTFKARIGPSAAATISFNGQSGAQLFGGVMASSITIYEIAV